MNFTKNLTDFNVFDVNTKNPSTVPSSCSHSFLFTLYITTVGFGFLILPSTMESHDLQQMSVPGLLLRFAGTRLSSSVTLL